MQINQLIELKVSSSYSFKKFTQNEKKYKKGKYNQGVQTKTASLMMLYFII